MSRRTVTEKFWAPRKVYGPNLFKIFADEVGGPARVAELLHETEETVRSWMVAAEQPPKDAAKVPRSAVLALYWETQYGRGQTSADLLNEIQLLHLHIKIVDAQFNKAKKLVDSLRRIHTGTANEAYFEELVEVSGCIPNRHGTSIPALPEPLPQPQRSIAWKPGQTFWSKKRAGT